MDRQHIRDNRIVLDDPRQVHHLRDVLRLAVGAEVVCSDGTGTDYHGRVTAMEAERLTVSVERVMPGAATAPLWLVQALPKADHFEWIIQKATELGASRIVPVISQHTVVRLAGARAQAKQQRWRRIAQEACRQCGRATVPDIDPVQSFAQALALLPADGLSLIPTLAVTAIPIHEIMQQADLSKPVVAMIGPEGDFSREEVIAAEAAGARPVSLGPVTLRSETAALAVLAMVAYARGSR